MKTTAMKGRTEESGQSANNGPEQQETEKKKEEQQESRTSIGIVILTESVT